MKIRIRDFVRQMILWIKMIRFRLLVRVRFDQPPYALLSEILGIQYHCLVGYDGNSKGSWTERSRYGIFEDPIITPEIFFHNLDSIIPS